MKITHCSTIQGLVLAAALSIGLGSVSPVFAQGPSYIVDSNSKTLTELGTLGGSYIEAFGIKAAGHEEVARSIGGGKNSQIAKCGPDAGRAD